MLKVFEGRIVFFAFLGDQVGGEHYLVEEIPAPLIHKRAFAFLGQQVIPRVEHVSLTYLVHCGQGTKYLFHALVDGVVVHVAHHEHLGGGIGLQYAVLDGLHLFSRKLAVVASAIAARPMAYNGHHVLACHLAAHSEKAAGLEGAVRGAFCLVG